MRVQRGLTTAEREGWMEKGKRHGRDEGGEEGLLRNCSL